MFHSIHVLVVEDFEPFRRFLSSVLEKAPELQIVGEVSDGLPAIRQAELLQPDLILIDIGLPTLNGIEAARRIHKLVPECRLLFLSQESSPDVVQEAFNSGARGYVVKAHAGSELLTAVEAVLEGRQFVSSGLAGHSFTPGRTALPVGSRSSRNSVSGIVNCATPQSKQTETLGNAQTPGLSMYLRPLKWMIISAVNSA